MNSSANISRIILIWGRFFEKDKWWLYHRPFTWIWCARGQTAELLWYNLQNSKGCTSPGPQSDTGLSSSVKTLVNIHDIVLLHSKSTGAQWRQHGVGYDGQCCVTRPDGLFGSAIVLATWWICIHFLHGQHRRTDPSLPLEKKPTEPHSRLGQTATSISLSSAPFVFISISVLSFDH